MGAEASVADAEELKLRYRCCCKSLHVRTASLIIAVFELFYLLYEIFSSFYLLSRTGDQYILSFSLSLFATFLAIVAVTLLLLAIKTTTPYLLIPHLLMQVTVIFVLFAMCLFCIFAAFAGTSIDLTIINIERTPLGEEALGQIIAEPYEYRSVSDALFILLIFASALTFFLVLFEVLMFKVVLAYYHYLQEKAYLKMQTSSRQTPIDCEHSLDDKNGDPLAAIATTRSTDLNSVSVSNTDIRDFTNPAETDC
uniref:Lysosomal-associated transmembrane protein 5 n=1 Tax=Ascaris lumbricoides TaxID=6252 RepID=A0A0M3IFM9_ASCLU